MILLRFNWRIYIYQCFLFLGYIIFYCLLMVLSVSSQWLLLRCFAHCNSSQLCTSALIFVRHLLQNIDPNSSIFWKKKLKSVTCLIYFVLAERSYSLSTLVVLFCLLILRFFVNCISYWDCFQYHQSFPFLKLHTLMVTLIVYL